MLNRGDIEAAFFTWRSAGLTPPRMTEQQGNNMINDTLKQYQYTSIEDWSEAVEWIANNNNRWATWFDINNALSIVRQNKAGQEKKAIEKSTKGLCEFAKKIMAELKAGKTFAELQEPPPAAVVKTAKRIFPDCTDEFIEKNVVDLAFIMRADRGCASCNNSAGCEWKGHQPYLRIDKNSGYTYLCASYERCPKYHPPAPANSR